MSPNKASFLQALGESPDLTDEACTYSVSQLISLAIGEQSHSVSLKNIHKAVSRYECAVYLEPLDILPILLPCRQDGAMDLIHLCALNNSPKELMIVIQEAIERVRARFNQEEREGEETDPGLVQTIIGIISLCSPAISRSTIGKRSPLELCAPILRDVTLLMASVSPIEAREEGRALIIMVARLVKSLTHWASTVADTDGVQQIKSILRELLDTTIVTCAPSIQAFLAVRIAETYFPHFFVKPSTTERWEDGVGAMLEVQHTLEGLGNSLQTIYRKPSSFSELAYLAHSAPPIALSPPPSSYLHHLLLNALQMNILIDEALFLLFRILTHDDMNISPEVAISLCMILSAIASTHLDPTIRQLNLRLLSLVLTKLPSPARLETLLKLSTDEDFPQIRGPAVGLLKEAVLEALALPSDHHNPFASSELLHAFGGVLFRQNPPEFFSENKTREELAESLELLRISDCLSFYYVLLQRDHENKTGVRCKGNVTSVQNSLLRPLRQFLADHIAKEEQPLMAILSLQVGLDRIDGALQTISLERDV